MLATLRSVANRVLDLATRGVCEVERRGRKGLQRVQHERHVRVGVGRRAQHTFDDVF